MSVYAVEYIYSPETVEARDDFRPVHRAWLSELIEAGTVLASGPYPDGSGALLLFLAGDDAALAALLAQDPFAIEHCITATNIHPWNPGMGLLKEYAL
ncbi:YciI family protein [Psychromicrobium xiongbiense]|uniref:YciI family protein n=1 Tax=Psychromicrobium xiongbiense TaxID=3051184 RepID=UPI0025527F1F|nr:YciI family protein [Psychromicrobium sp. YIM S02556]